MTHDATSPLQPPVCVLLPVHKDAATLPLAFASLQAQTLRDWRCLLLVNGADDATKQCAAGLAQKDQRCELVDLPASGLAAALNAGLRRAAQLGLPLAARMDADDWSFPQRLAKQVEAMRGSKLAAVGCGWEVWDGAMHKLVATVHPPCDAREARWRVLLDNPFAHGSMMLRVQSVLEAGGYDEAMSKAQDYGLWLKLCRRGALVGAIADVLYRHRSKSVLAGGSVREQARFAADAQLRAWGQLPFDASTQLREVLCLHKAGEISRDNARERVEKLLTEHGPTREGLMAYLALGGSTEPVRVIAGSVEGKGEGQSSQLAGQHTSQAGEPRRVYDASDVDGAFGEKLATHVRGLAKIVPGKVYVYPAGRVARRAVVEHALNTTIIAGLVDDRATEAATALREVAGDNRSLPPVITPGELPGDSVVVIASHAHADALWEASGFMRARGILVELVGEGARRPTGVEARR